jgi:hypothetical protein
MDDRDPRLDVVPDGMYIVEWSDGSRRLLFGHRIIAYPVSRDAKTTRLGPLDHGTPAP